MARRERKTFRDVLQKAAPRIARELEIRAQTASRLAKIQPRHAAQLYSLKSEAIRQLFRIPGQMPFIRDAWTTQRGFLLSIHLCQTGSFLHVPFEKLTEAAQQFYGAWVAKRAHGNRWQPVNQTRVFRAGSAR